MTAAIVATDAAGRITTLNPAAEALFGLTSAQAIGRPIHEVVDLLDMDGAGLDPRSLMSGEPGGHWQGRLVARPRLGSRTGRHMLIDVTFAPVAAETGPASGVIASCCAVTPGGHEGSAGFESIAAATTRARSTREIAGAALDRLCEITSADVAIIATWKGDGAGVEATRGIDEGSVRAMENSSLPRFRAALVGRDRIMDLEDLAALFPGADLRHAAAHGPVTGIIVELRTRDESIGFLGLGSTRPAWPRPPDEEIVAAAAQIASALDSARLTERLEIGRAEERRLIGQLETLVGLTLLPGDTVDEKTIAGLLLERVIAALGADGGLTIRGAGERLQVFAAQNLDERLLTVLETIPAESMPIWSNFLRDDKTAYHERLGASSGQPGLGWMREQGIVSFAAFPLRESGRLYGALICFFFSVARAAEVDQRNVEAVGRIISIASANARMSAGLARAARNEGRLVGTLRTLQELTLLGASTDDLGRLARETVDSVVAATGASGGGYMLVDPTAERIDPFIWIGSPSSRWPEFGEATAIPADWPPFERFRVEEDVWISVPEVSPSGADGRFVQAVLPLRVDGRLAGLLPLEWAGAAAVDVADVHILGPIARTCSISLANFRLRAELMSRAGAQRALGHRVATLEDLTRIGEEAGSSETPFTRMPSVTCWLKGTAASRHAPPRANLGPSASGSRACRATRSRPAARSWRAEPASSGSSWKATSTRACSAWLHRRSSGPTPRSRSARETNWPVPSSVSSGTLPSSTRGRSTRSPELRESPWPTSASASGWSPPRSGTGRCSRSRPRRCS